MYEKSIAHHRTRGVKSIGIICYILPNRLLLLFFPPNFYFISRSFLQSKIGQFEKCLLPDWRKANLLNGKDELESKMSSSLAEYLNLGRVRLGSIRNKNNWNNAS